MKSRWIVVVVALAAACAFTFSVQLGRWWSIGDVEIGPFGSRHCFGEGDCKSASLAWIGGGDRFMRLGISTWAAGLVAAFMLLVLAAGVAAKRVPKLVAKSVLVSIIVASLVGIGFVVTYPGVDGAGIDRGAWLYVTGVVFAIVAAIWVLRATAEPRG